MNSDLLTQIFRWVIELLLLQSPYRTALGILLGFGIAGLLPFLGEVTGLPFEQIKWPEVTCISLSLVIINIPNLFKKYKIPLKYKKTIDFIEKGRREGTLSEEEARERYRILIERVMNEESKQQFISELQKISASELRRISESERKKMNPDD